MGNTVSNQKKVVATKGTPHVARTSGATDVGINPANGAKAPFPNEVASALLRPGTSRTVIANQKIWTKPHQLGPPSKPVKAPFVVGERSGTHIMEAKATSYSTDVFAEGNAVVRTDDTTTQNHANTTGFVDGSALTDTSQNEEDFLKKQCTIVELTGINEVDGSPPDGLSVGTPPKVARPLGYPGRRESVPPYYLEILSATEVDFKSVRKDVTVPNSTNPTCWKGGIHTQWLARRTGLGATEAKPVDGTEEFKVDSALTGIFFDSKDALMKTLGGNPVNSAVDRATKVEASGTLASPPAGSNTRVDGKTSVSASGVVSSLEAVFAFYLYRSNPAFINVQALSCGGSRNAILKLFPAQSVDYTIDLSSSLTVTNQTETSSQGTVGERIRNARRAIENAKIVLGKLKDTSEYVKKIASLASQQFAVEFLVSTSINFKVAYKACAEEKRGLYGNLYTPSHVGLTWSLTFTSSKLVGFSVTFNISLINLVAPGLGEGAATALRTVGVRADLVFTASLSVPLSFSVGQDEYDFWTTTGVEIAIRPELSLSIAVGFVIDIVRFGVRFPMSLSAGFFGGDKPKVLVQLQPKGELKTVLFLILLEGSWFERKWEHEPEDWRVNWQGPKLDIITVA
jgi:hypothetical protein